jgi:hypothetical protein
MDNGTAIIIASLVPTITSIVNRVLAARAERRAATLLKQNTELTLKVEKSTNSMKDALVEATRQAAEAKGLALGLVQGEAKAAGKKDT